MTTGNTLGNKNCYIPSLQAADIYGHSERGQELHLNKKGMIPYSLELIKLREQKGLRGFKEVRRKNSNWNSQDVINVKFDYKTKKGDVVLLSLNNKLKKIIEKIEVMDTADKKYTKLKEDINKYEVYISKIDAEVIANDEKWNSISRDELRKRLYKNGFTITDENGKTQKYLVYKRSAGKSRKGECLFIKEELHDVMKSWARMNLPFAEGADVDLSSLLSYESLVNSSIIGTISIDSSSILLIDDVDSVFMQKANVIKKVDGKLESVPTEKASITNSIWDGQSLIDKSVMESVGLADKGFILLRNHFYKSAAFNTNIQEFLTTHKPEEYESLDDWYLTDMLNNSIKASDIRLITTPNSLKILKFSSLLGSKNAIYEHWKEFINDFGICKYEKETKQGNKEGIPLQQLSYQMVNSLPAIKENIENLSRFEVEYIESMKANNDIFIDFLKKNEDSVNSNEVYIALYERNHDIANTLFFTNFKSKKIFNYIEHLKNGHIRIEGDYQVLAGNLLEMLKSIIGKFDVNDIESHSLKGNQVYTTLFNFEEDLVAFRSPHSSTSNILSIRNTYIPEIEEWFNLTNNIIAVNTIKFALCDILSGSDFDSDSVLTSSDKTLRKLIGVDTDEEKYPVCINGVGDDKTPYTLSNEQMSKVDSSLANNLIGTVVNLGQLGNSIYWDLISQGKNEEAAQVMKKVDIISVLSGLCIDTAKREYDINFKSEIANIKKFLQPLLHMNEAKDADGKVTKLTVYKPLFFKYIDGNANDVVDVNKKKVVEYKGYSTPMDYLCNILDAIDDADKTDIIEMDSLLVDSFEDSTQVNYEQIKKVVKIGEDYTSKINKIYLRKLTDESKRELNNIVREVKSSVAKLEIKPVTMQKLIISLMCGKKRNSRFLKIIHETQGDKFINTFIEKS